MADELFIFDTIDAVSDDDIDAAYIALCHEDILPASPVGPLARFLEDVEARYPGGEDSVWKAYPHLTSPNSLLLCFSSIRSGDSVDVLRSLALERGFIVYEPTAKEKVYRPSEVRTE